MEAKWIRTVRKRSDLGAIGGTIILFIVFSLIAPDSWLTSFTLSNVLHIAAILGIVAIGQAMLLISHEIDLSVGSVYGVAATAFLSFEPSLGIVGSFLAAMLIAALIGFLNGLLTLKGRVASMIVTLGGLFFYRGVIFVTTGGTLRTLTDEARVHPLTVLLGGNFLVVENAILWLIFLAVVFSIVLSSTRYGNHIRAAGGDAASALVRGVRVERTKWIAFVCCSCLAGFSGIVTVADRPQTYVTLGEDVELESIVAAVIGGCLLAGGRGSILGAVLGAFILSAIRFQLIAIGAPPYWFITFVGIFLILALLGNTALASWLRRA